MIEIKVNDGILSVNGHAGYDEEGKDIVCASVSSLLQTFMTSMALLTEDKIKYEISPDRVRIDIGNLTEESKLLADSFFIGVKAIDNTYSDYVQVEREEKREEKEICGKY